MPRIIIENMRGSSPRVVVKDNDLFVSYKGTLYEGGYLKQNIRTAKKFFTDDNTLTKKRHR